MSLAGVTLPSSMFPFSDRSVDSLGDMMGTVVCSCSIIVQVQLLLLIQSKLRLCWVHFSLPFSFPLQTGLEKNRWKTQVVFKLYVVVCRLVFLNKKMMLPQLSAPVLSVVTHKREQSILYGRCNPSNEFGDKKEPAGAQKRAGRTILLFTVLKAGVLVFNELLIR